jgi:hypothetical protein
VHCDSCSAVLINTERVIEGSEHIYRLTASVHETYQYLHHTYSPHTYVYTSHTLDDLSGWKDANEQSPSVSGQRGKVTPPDRHDLRCEFSRIKQTGYQTRINRSGVRVVVVEIVVLLSLHTSENATSRKGGAQGFVLSPHTSMVACDHAAIKAQLSHLP